MRTVTTLSMVLAIAVFLPGAAVADIIVLNNGQVVEGKITSAAGDNLKLEVEFGEQQFPKTQVARYFLTPKGMEAEGYYQAGMLLAGKGKMDAARQLFEACVKYDATYRDKCTQALRTPPTVPATTPAPVVAPPGTDVAATTPPELETKVVTLQCPGCGGTGTVMMESSINPDRGTQRMRPCPICGGKGYRVLEIPPGYEICPSCGGFGATSGGGGGGSSKSSFTNRKVICPRCAGRGLIKTPWRPPEEGDTGTSRMMVTAPSLSPGSPPSRPMSPTDRARSVASGGPAGGPPSREVGPSGVRPVSPTIITETSPSQESGEEIVEESSESSSDASAEGTTEESKSDEETGPPPDTPSPGFVGWLKDHRLYIILGGVALLVFAIVFSKMSGKK